MNLFVFGVACDVFLMVLILINIAFMITFHGEIKSTAQEVHNMHKTCKFRGEKIAEIYGKVEGK